MKQKTKITMGLMVTIIMAIMMIIQLVMDRRMIQSEDITMYDWLGLQSK